MQILWLARMHMEMAGILLGAEFCDSDDLLFHVVSRT